MAKEATTIYIDDSAIWVLATKGRKPQKWASMPLESDLVQYGVILNEDAVASKVRELWQNQDIGARRVIAGISGINCLYRLLTLPELSKDLLPEAVRREAGRVLGVPLEQLHLSWQAIPSMRGEILVYVVASPRNSVDTQISTLRKAGLNPYLMDLKPLALARTITEPKAIIIDLQPTSFDIVVMAEGVPQVVRSLALSLTRQALMEEKVPIIREELGRTITFYNSSHMDKPIDAAVPLLVCGELADRPDIGKLLLGRQERPVQMLPLPMETPEGFPSGQYVTNIGLALKEVLTWEKGAIAYSLVNLNVLPEIYIPKPRPISEILFIPTIIAGIALVALGAFFNISALAYTTALRNELAAINQMTVSRQVRVEDIMPLTQKVSSLEEAADAFTTTLRDFTAGRDEVNADLSQINGCLPGAVVPPISISCSGDTLTVQGSADDEYAVFSYATALKASGRFAMVVITDMSLMRGDGQQMGFTLTLTR